MYSIYNRCFKYINIDNKHSPIEPEWLLYTIKINVIILVTEGFWDLVSESIFTEVLVACNKFTTLHSKFIQTNLHNVPHDVLLVSS